MLRQQPFYYHVGRRNTNNCDYGRDFQVKVTLRKVISSPSSSSSSSSCLDGKTTTPGQDEELFDATTKRILSWQEKIHAPCKKYHRRNNANTLLKNNVIMNEPTNRINETHSYQQQDEDNGENC